MTLVETTKSRKPLLLALIGLLLLTNGYLLFKSNEASKEVSSLSISNTQLQDAKRNLQLEFDETVRSLDQMKIENATMSASMTELNSRVEEQKAELASLLKKNKWSKSQLNEVKARLYSLQLDTENYRRTIVMLQEENDSLTVQNVALYTEVENQNAANTLLVSANEDLTETKNNLSETNEMLAAKVAKGEIIVTNKVLATGVKYKSSGKEVPTTNARKAEKIKVCFDALANKVTEQGEHEVLVRLTSPEGSPISIEALGSGTFTDGESGEEKNYTTKTNIDFNGNANSYCMYWEQDQAYMDGTYQAEVYHKNTLIGKTKFDLKKGLL